MILLLDNYDSFTYNLLQYMGELGANLEVIRNDTLSVEEILNKKPTHIVISPGPCTPKEAGISVELIKKTPSHIPLLGVCLGHQSIGEAYEGEVIRAPYLMHGKTSEIQINATNQGGVLFKGLPPKLIATRYHSLIVRKENFPSCLNITAETEDGLIMGLQHKEKPVFGLQFHPESILTEDGKLLLKNFLDFLP